MASITQSAPGEPLRSEQRLGEYLPRTLKSFDLLVLFIAIVLFVPNTSVVLGEGIGVNATYLYWLIGGFTFLLPGAVVTGQLNRLMPADGSIYVWTHRALGSLWGFFAGFCAWVPGILVPFVTSATVVALIQGLGFEIYGQQVSWLALPWTQGLLLLGIIALVTWLSTRRLERIMRLARWAILLYGVGLLILGLAGLFWLLQGHRPQIPAVGPQPALGNISPGIYGVVVLALLGVEVPFNLSAETSEQTKAARLTLIAGPLLVMAAYLVGTFGVATVVPQTVVGLAYAPLVAINNAFGLPLTIVVSLLYIGFFLISTVLYNISFARILFVSALDHRLPGALAHLNRHRAPSYASTFQMSIVVILTVATYFIGPVLYQTDETFSTRVYDVLQATTSVIWCISMVILFLDLPVIPLRFPAWFARHPEQLIAPRWLLYCCSLVGGLASLCAIWTTLTASWDSNLIPNTQWSLIIGMSALATLVIGLVGSAYPRLLSSLNEQIAAARENARLYSELQTAYARLSELDQMKDAFITTASHELRTPLTIVQGYLELLSEMEGADPATRRTFLQHARRACDELVLLQANIMDASRVAFDATLLHCHSLSLRTLCQSVCELFEPLLLKEQRELKLDIDEDIVVWADEMRLKQILRNLISNALRYSREGTPIVIRARRVIEATQPRVRISVIDRGAGIPADKQEAIFEKFVRLERDMHGLSRGSGLGLYITRALVEAMRGHITVESSGVEGEGSTFIFTLPATPPPAAASETEGDVTASPPPPD